MSTPPASPRPAPSRPADAPARLRLEARGAVQGVGFRPFVFRLATELGVGGWIANDPEGVRMEVEAAADVLADFVRRLQRELPRAAALHELRQAPVSPVGETEFTIRGSHAGGRRGAVVLPDLASCAQCLDDVQRPGDRRYGYPFANCTNCGPRFSIVRALPYDRPNTTMAGFTMCAACAAEYADPRDRRFHAQPNACADCGPRLALWDAHGRDLHAASSADAVAAVAQALADGQIVAVKGLGGFHLMADARSAEAVCRMRRLKRRPTKPLALMVRDLAQARELCELPPEAEAVMESPAAPIVLLARLPGAEIAREVAPGNPTLGLMLPPTPLHHLLLRAAGFPLVATSGNLSEEPICTDEAEAVERLGGIADLFLVHDRPIERHVDDSVAWVLRGQARLLRRARGYAPLPVRLTEPVPPVLAVGAHLKSAVALGLGRQVFLSQHIGDLETPQAYAAFERVIADFLRLYDARPVAVAHDLHPDYLSTRWADAADEVLGPEVRRIAVQHHHAHLAACLAENHASGSALGVIWDGAGLGPDGTVWGGEFLLGDAAGYERVASLLPFRLPGGDAAAREPRRVALALLWEMLGAEAAERIDFAPVAALAPAERALLAQMLEREVRSPVTTSMGRLFDGVAALLDLRQTASFEGEAAMALEHAADADAHGAYALPLLPPAADGGPLRLDWRATLATLLEERARGIDPGRIAARFHDALVGGILAVARHAGVEQVALSGGAFQNRLLTERAARALERAGHRVLLHRAVPPNDGGIALGQVAIAAALVPIADCGVRISG
jgi:hydrogenase maturation protein HypF